MQRAGWIALAAIAISAPAHAQGVMVDAPGGRAADAAIAIARQTGSSIVIADPVLAGRRVPAIRGRFSAAEAVKRLAREAGARPIQAGTGAWRLVPLARARTASVSAPRPRVAPAAPPPESVGEDIVVIGSKREVPLTDYPGQAEVVDGEALAFGGVGGTEKIMQRVPTVSSTYLGSGRNKLFIRGIADSSFTGPTQSTVGQYMGDLRLSYNAPDPDLRLSDLARVEVLEGPQGTLYGAGSLGGIIRLVPNEPEMGLAAASAMVGGSATQHGAVGGDASATANLPLIGDAAALRVTVNAESQGGYIDKPLLGREDVNRTRIYSGRATVRFALSPDWTVDAVGIAQRTDGRDSQYADRDGPPLSRAAQVREGFEADYTQGQLVVTGSFGAVRFKSSTGVTGQQVEERYDATLPSGTPRLFVQQNDTSMVANETRIWQPLGDRVGWVVGASYTHNRTELTRELGIPLLPLAVNSSNVVTVGQNGVMISEVPLIARTAVTGVSNLMDEITVYGEGSIRLADALVATAGGRFTHARLNGEGEDVAVAVAAANSDVTASRREDVLLPSASLAANVLPGTTFYLRYQEAFRPGGLAVAGDFVSRFDNDRIATFELGGRYGVPGRGPFDVAASVSYNRWQDIQADFIDSAGFPSTANIGDGRIWTASFAAGIAVTPNLRIDGGLTFNDGRIDDPPAFLVERVALVLNLPELTQFTGNVSDLPLAIREQITEIPNVARFSGRLGFDYWRPVGETLELTAQGWVNYVGRSRLGLGPELGEAQGDYLDTGVTVRIGRQDLGVSLSLTNLTDEEGNRFALGTPFAIGRDQITPLRPRTLRLGLDAAF